MVSFEQGVRNRNSSNEIGILFTRDIRKVTSKKKIRVCSGIKGEIIPT